MKKITAAGCLAGMLAVLLPVAVQGAYTQPTEAQIAAAAADPGANLAALLQDASAAQAAQIVKLVVAQAITAGAPSDSAVHIAAIISDAVGAIGVEMRMAFADALGTALAGCEVVVTRPEVVSAIQGAIAAAGGTEGGVIAQAFGAAYQAARLAQGFGQTTKDSPPPVGPDGNPLKANLYEGETL